jgi:hypothetical protein
MQAAKNRAPLTKEQRTIKTHRAQFQTRLGVVKQVQLYLGLFVCANGKIGGSMRYQVSLTRQASCATDIAQ